MFEKKGQYGFSLMEVLFSIVVLSLGLVFVAAMFPVGISYNRVVVETTMGDIETHNATAMAELQIESGYVGQISGSPGIFFVDTTPTSGWPGGEVRFLCQPNVRIYYDDIVMDDPTGVKFTLIPLTPAEYGWNSPDAKDDVPNYLSTDLAYTGSGSVLARRNIGTLVSPAVTMRDWQVERYLQKFGDYYPDNFWYADSTIQFFEQMDEAMHAVSMDRKNSCSYLYQCLDTNDKTFRFLIFYLKIDQRNRRYAMQNPAGSVAVEALDDTEDRLFPVPWRVDLTMDQIDINPGDPTDGIYYRKNTLHLPLDRFEVSLPPPSTSGRGDNLIDLLCVGSIIVDADPEIYPYSGLTYEIIDIEPVEIGGRQKYQVRLRTELQYDLRYFWVFPPSVEAVPYRHTANYPRQFRDVQPVIKMAEKIMDF